MSSRLLAAIAASTALVLVPAGALLVPSTTASAAPTPTSTTATTSATAVRLAEAFPAGTPSPDARPAPRSRAAVPSLRVTTRASGLDHAWDVKQIDGQRLLITERDPAQLTVARRDGTTYAVRFPAEKVWTSGETGLMGLEVDPAFARNGRFYTCSGWNLPGGQDIRVNAWRMNDARTRARLVGPLVTGLPTTSGRHGGCRLLIASNGALLVGTGDAAVGTNPRDLGSLGGKTLRLDRTTGAPWPTNPFVRAKDRDQRYVLTYGHRNVQGLAERQDGSLWSVEHGSDVDDEVNKLVPGGDYGWHPVPGYNESVPMTDQSLPGKQVAARWSSGRPTLATSGSSFVYGKQWGRYRGALAVAALKTERVVFLKFDADGRDPKVFTPSALQRYGRLRTVTRMANGNLLVATDGVDGQGRILMVRPAR
jgi:glucose/arabinose dehydrogenase